MDVIPVFQVIGAVAGVLLSISGLMLISSFGYVNQVRDASDSLIRDLLLAMDKGMDIDKAIESYKKLQPGMKWTTFDDLWNATQEGHKMSEDFRDYAWKTWKSILLFSILALLTSGMGLFAETGPTDPNALLLLALATLSLSFGIFSFYRLAKLALDLSKLVPGPMGQINPMKVSNPRD